MPIDIPEFSLVLLIGPSGAGKSTFAKKHFLEHETISSDRCRGMVSNDENDQAASNDAFQLLHYLTDIRLKRGLLTVIDATNVNADERKRLVAIAKRHDCFSVAIVFNLPENICWERNQARPDRTFGRHVLLRQWKLMRKSLRELEREKVRFIHVLNSPEQVDAAQIVRTPLWCNRKAEVGPFDIIGDLHGCCDELEELLDRLGYIWKPCERPSNSALLMDRVAVHPEGRRVIYVGDFVDRGPRSVDTLRTVATMMHHGSALCVPGNHDVKLLKKFSGRDVQIKHGLAETLADIERLPEEERKSFIKETSAFIDGLVSHLVLDGGQLVVAHAGMKQEYQGRTSGRVREFALYGETTGETDEFGLPVRYPWAEDYDGDAHVVYGHTPVPTPKWLNRTINVDTGCVFGGALTALRYPEREFVSIPAKQVYCTPLRPFLISPTVPQEVIVKDHVLDLQDVLGKRILHTKLMANLTIQEQNATAALEIMSRFAIDPKWLIYLPPTMSPSETSSEPGLLEHPKEAIEYYRAQGVKQLVCEEKHMGSRAVVVLCRDERTAQDRFGVTDGSSGVIYTRTGRRFLNDSNLETQLLEHLRQACERAGLWDSLNTSWACFDCELMPWSAKAIDLLKSQYAAVGAAGKAALGTTTQTLKQTLDRLTSKGDVQYEPQIEKVQSLHTSFERQTGKIEQFVEAYRRYCWQVESLSDWKLAPFHLLATEGKVHSDRSHVWHMEQLHSICNQDPDVLLATDWLLVDTDASESEEQATQWWMQKTAAGAEGMVVKPHDWINRSKNGLVQPAVKCRGKEYLRIIYGPDYDSEENLTRLRRRGLGRKRSLACREFALGIEALERFISQDSLRKVHECVFGILALESEPVDPRL